MQHIYYKLSKIRQSAGNECSLKLGVTAIEVIAWHSCHRDRERHRVSVRLLTPQGGCTSLGATADSTLRARESH